MTWASFSSLFVEKYIPRTFRDRKRNEFLRLEQGRMSVNAYEAKFRALSRYATQLCFSPQERISPVCEGVEVRIADFGLIDSGNGKILPRGGRLCDISGRSEARRLHPGIDIKKVSKGR